MEFNSLTTVLTTFIQAFDLGFSNLVPSVTWLTGTLLAIELILVGLFWALSGGAKLVEVFKKLLFIAFWLMLVTNFQSWAKTFVDSLVGAGLIAGGQAGNYDLLLDPSRIAGYGVDATYPLVQKLSHITFNIGEAIIIGLSYIFIMITFLIIAIQVFLTMLEYYLILALASILLPWGLLKPTKFIAEKAIGAVISAGIKMMVLAFIIAIAEPTLSSISIASSDATYNEIWSVLLTSGCLAFLAWNAPGLAAGLISGSPSLSAGTAVQNVIAGAMMGGMAAQATVGATRAAAQGMKNTAAVGTQAVGAFQAGANLSGPFDSKTASSSALSRLSGGVKAASASLVQSTVGKGVSGFKEATGRNISKGTRAAYSATGGKSTPGMEKAAAVDCARSGSQQQGQAPNWSQNAMRALHATPQEARPSGLGPTPKL